MLPGDDASLTLLEPSSRTVPFVLEGVRSEDHQQLFVSPGHEGSVLLQKPFYADFMGSGAIIDDRVDAGYQAMYPIGKIHLSVATTLEERSKARQQRIAYSRRLAEIARFYDSRRRVLPKTMRMAWLQRTEHCQFKFLSSDRRFDELK